MSCLSDRDGVEKQNGAEIANISWTWIEQAMIIVVSGSWPVVVVEIIAAMINSKKFSSGVLSANQVSKRWQ